MIARAERRAFALDPAAIKRLLAGSTRGFSGAAAGCGTGILDAAAALAAIDALIDHYHPETEDG